MTSRYAFYGATLSLSLLMLLGCSSESDSETPQVGIANPASEYCIKLGGQLIPQEDEAGNQYALCQLPDGSQIEEWVLFRQDHIEP